MLKYFYEAPFFCYINYLIISSKYTKNKYSEVFTHVSILHHITQFTTQNPSSHNYSQFYYLFRESVCFITKNVICNFTNTSHTKT
jgi:hypothetical protein